MNCSPDLKLINLFSRCSCKSVSQAFWTTHILSESKVAHWLPVVKYFGVFLNKPTPLYGIKRGCPGKWAVKSARGPNKFESQAFWTYLPTYYQKLKGRMVASCKIIWSIFEKKRPHYKGIARGCLLIYKFTMFTSLPAITKVDFDKP